MSEAIKVNIGTDRQHGEADKHAALWRAVRVAAEVEAKAGAHTHAAIVACGRAGLTYKVAPDDVRALIGTTHYSRATRIDKIVTAFGYELATVLESEADVSTFRERFNAGRAWVNDSKSIRQALGMDGSGSDRAEESDVIHAARENGLTLDTVGSWKSILLAKNEEDTGESGDDTVPDESPAVSSDTTGEASSPVVKATSEAAEVVTARVDDLPTVAALVVDVNGIADALHRHRGKGTDIAPVLSAIGALVKAFAEAERLHLADILAKSVGKVLRAAPKPAAPKQVENKPDADVVRAAEVAAIDQVRKDRAAKLASAGK